MRNRDINNQENFDKKKKEFKDNMHLSTDYIDWLEEYTKENNSIATDSYLFYIDNITKEDKDNILLLEALYEVIEEFAHKNYIFPKDKEFTESYYIKHNDVGYQIGFNYGQVTSYFCNRLKKPKEHSIEYKQLMSGVKLPSTIRIEEELQELEELLNKLIEVDVPEEAINQMTNKILQKSLNNKRNN